MAMSHKDYELIAAHFREQIAAIRQDQAEENPHFQDVLRGELAGVIRLATNLSISLRMTNPAFHPQRFLDACGI